MLFSLVGSDSKLQSGAARGFGQRLDSTVVWKTATVEDHVLDARFAGTLGDRLADRGRAFRARWRLERLAQVGIGTGGSRQRPARGIIDHLRVDVVQAAEDRQPRPGRTTLEVAAQPAVPADARGATIRHFIHLFRGSGAGLPGLARLPADALTAVEDALALVGFGRADLPHLGRDLADVFFTRPFDIDPRRLGDVDRDARRYRVADRVRESHVEHQRLALTAGAITHADQLELLLIALAHALDHVPDQRPGEAVQRAVLFRLTRPFDDDAAVLHRDAHRRIQHPGQLRLAALDRNGVVRDRDRHARRNLDRELANPTHGVTKRNTRPRHRGPPWLLSDRT